LNLNAAIRWLLAGTIAITLAAAQAQGFPKFGLQFQAEMVTTGPGHPPGGTIVKMAVGASVVRVEMAMEGERVIIIMRERNGMVEMTMIFPDDELYQVMMLPAAAALAMAPLPDTDPDFDPRTSCSRPPAGVRCTDLGRRQVAGRTAHGYRIEGQTTAGGPDRMTTWLDVETGIPLRTEYDDGTVTEFRSFRVGPPPAELFVVPAGYERMGG
jgi:hypothetical protein